VKLNEKDEILFKYLPLSFFRLSKGADSIVWSSFLVQEVLWFFLDFLLAFDFKLWLVLIELHELGEIELGLLEELDLSDKDVLEGEDFSTFLLNLLAN